MKNFGLITATLICVLLLAACKKSKVDRASTNYFTEGGSYQIVPDTIIANTQNNTWVLHAFRNGNYKTHIWGRRDDLFITFPGKYIILPAGNYQIVSSLSSLSAGKVYVNFSYLQDLTGSAFQASSHGNAIDGQVQVSQIDEGQIRIVFNGLNATNSWWQSAELQVSSGYDTIKLSADLTY